MSDSMEVPLGDPVVLTFVLLPVLLTGALAWAAAFAWRQAGRSRASARVVALGCAAAGSAWMAITWQVARSGVLRDWHGTPPPLAILVAAILALAFLIAFSPVGRLIATHVPVWALVAIQGFRFPLELAMHEMYERGVMPEQMSYSGRNFDVITGVTALIVAALVWSGSSGRGLVAGWNLLGLALLGNIVVIAIASTPLYQYFGPDRLNIWVTYPPFVWLPAVMVLAALAGHLIVFRALRARR